MPSIPTDLASVERGSADRRPYTTMPYDRPASARRNVVAPSQPVTGETQPDISAMSTPARLTRSFSLRSLPQSASQGIFSILRSAVQTVQAPMAWFTSPPRNLTSTGTKRDLASFDADVEDPESPSAARDGKRQRRASPPPLVDKTYAPPPRKFNGLSPGPYNDPPLFPLHINLNKARDPSRFRDAPLASGATNFSRPLTSSKSMPYFDRIPVEDESMDGSVMGGEREPRSGRAQTKDFGPREQWSPWKQNGMSPVIRRPSAEKPTTPTRASRAYALPSVSPFNSIKQSPLARGGTYMSGLSRSNTVANPVNRTSFSVAPSDVSMGQGSTSNNRKCELFARKGYHTEYRQYRMSAAGPGFKDSMDVEPFSPRRGQAESSSRDALGLPAKKGQMIWVEKLGFMREDDLMAMRSEKPTYKNPADEILAKLEKLRKSSVTDDHDARGLPSSLIGASSRSIRKAISVPLAAAHAQDTARQRRERDRLGGDDYYSSSITPYGARRRTRPPRSHRQERSAAEHSDEYKSRSTVSMSHSSGQPRRTREKSDQSMGPESEVSPVPVPTPRRSSRLKRHENAQPDEEDTPKTRKSSRGKTAKSSRKLKAAAVETPTLRKSTRRSREPTIEKRTSPEPPPVPSVPTITETAPSPSEGSKTSTYAPRTDDQLPRGSSSLRAKSDVSRRVHTGAASLGTSRATSPSTGRFSAREEDLPDLDDLDEAYIALPSFQGIKLNLSTPLVQPSSTSTAVESLTSIEPVDSVASAPAKISLLGVNRGPVGRVQSTRPRASSPLASNSITAEPEELDLAAVGPKQHGNGFDIVPLASPSLFAGLTHPPAQTVEPPSDIFGSGPSKRLPPLSDKVDEPATKKSHTFFAVDPKTVTDSPTPTPTPLFNFSNPRPAQVDPPQAGFTFDHTAAPSLTPNPSARPAFSFGSFQSKSTPSTNPAANEPTMSTETQPYSTVSANTPQPRGPPALSTASFAAASEFPSTPATSSLVAVQPDEAPKLAGLFGTPSVTPSIPSQAPTPAPFAFPAPSTALAKPTEAAPKSLFTFQPVSGSSKPEEKGPSIPTNPTPASNSAFGSLWSAKPAEGALTSGDGTVAAPPAASPSSSAFAFGQNTSSFKMGTFGNTGSDISNGLKPPAPPFGSTPQIDGGSGASIPSVASTPHTPFTFGAPAPQSPTPGSAPLFGSQPPAVSPGFGIQPTAGGGFGSLASGSAPSFANPAVVPNSFTFNSPSSSTPNPVFGSGSTSANPPAANGFGNSVGNGFSNGFGNNHNQPAPAPSPSTFGFQPVQSPAASSYQFTFAGSAGGQNGTPAPAAAEPFVFGSPANRQTTPGTPGDGGGGFSAGQPPSPAGRKIKPLRRGMARR